MSSILAAYFSRAGQNYVNGSVKSLPVGNTEVVARMIADATGGDLFKLETVHSYASDYYECTEEAKREKNEGARPELVRLPESIDSYGVVVVCYPNWWGTMPMAVYTFLEAFDFSGKTVLPLCTHEGSGLSGTERDIARACPGARVLKGLAIHGADAATSRPQVEAWLKRSLS